MDDPRTPADLVEAFKTKADALGGRRPENSVQTARIHREDGRIEEERTLLR